MYTQRILDYTRTKPEDVLVYGFLTFIFLALIQPHTGLYRALFYLSAIPLSILLIKDIRNIIVPLRNNTAFISGVVLIIFLIASTFWTPVDNDDPYKIVRKGLQTLLFFYASIRLGQTLSGHRVKVGEYLQLILIMSLVASFWYYFQDNRYPGRISGISRILQNPIQGSQIFSILLLLSVFLKRNQGLWLTLITAVLTLGYIYLAASRGTIVSLILATMIGILFSQLYSQKTKLIILISATILCLVASQIPLIHDYFSLREFHRLNIWIASMSNMEGMWLLGHGYGLAFNTSPAGLEAAALTNRDYIMHPHSLYVATLYHAGVIGLSLMLLFITSLIYKCRRDTAAIILLLFILFACSTDNPYLFSSVKEIWFLFWLPIGVLIGCFENSSYPNPDKQHG